MDVAFIVDPLTGLKPYKDTSIAMMRALARRGHRIYAMQQDALWWRGGGTRATVQHLTLGASDDDWHRAGDAEVRELAQFAAVMMRKDPPFDMEYVYSTYILEQAEAAGARVFNRPRAIRDNNEKMAIAPFHEFISPTLVTRDADLVQAFIDEHADVIVKPLDGMGGTSIFRVRADDANRNVIVETVGGLGARTIMVQRYIPEIVDGDKRIILIAGEVVPYALARIPRAGRNARQSRRRRPRRRAPAHRARPRDRRGAGAQAVGAGPAGGRPRRHRTVPHGGQRHQPDLLRRDQRAVGIRRRRQVRRGAGDRGRE